MNCFELANRTCDYLDGTLNGPKKLEADRHLDTCEECAERQGHYRIILNTISSQPRSALPIPIRKSPFHVAVPKLDVRLGISRWERIPWYLRTTIEATGIVLLTLIGISMGPRIRSLYETKIEKSLSDLSQAFNDPVHAELSKTARGAKQPGATAPGGTAEPIHDEFSSEGEEEESDAKTEQTSESEEGEVFVGKSDIWRFTLKTDSPYELRPRIVEMLGNLKAPGDQQNIEGVRAPGGIQFDLVLPQTAIPNLKKLLLALAPPAPEGLADTPVGETFTWYKIKSKRKIPDGMTRVVIWISQL